MGEITGERKMSFDITKCKPFNLERALAGDKVVTRDGREITEIYYFKTLPDAFPVVSVIDGSLFRFNKEGRSLYRANDKDFLLMAPRTKKFEAWVNVYIYGFACVTYNTKKEAEECTGEGHIKTIKIETEIEI